MLITGPSQSGKTALLKSLLAEHGRPFVRGCVPFKPVISPGQPIGNVPSCLASEILDRFHGGQATDDDPDTDVVDHAFSFLGRHATTDLLVLDDLWSNPDEQMMRTIERIRVESDTSIVLTGDEPEASGER